MRWSGEIHETATDSIHGGRGGEHVTPTTPCTGVVVLHRSAGWPRGGRWGGYACRCVTVGTLSTLCIPDHSV